MAVLKTKVSEVEKNDEERKKALIGFGKKLDLVAENVQYIRGTLDRENDRG